MSDEQTLAGLIADRKGTRSYDKLSKDCGGTPTSKRLHQLANVAPKNFPDPDTIRGLATGLGVTVTDIVMASARSLELPVYTGNDPNALSIGGAGALPESAKETLTTVAREFIKLTSQPSDGVENENTSTQGTPSNSEADGKAGSRGTPMMNRAAAAFGERARNVIREDNAPASTSEDQAAEVDQENGLKELRQVEFDLARRTVKGGSKEKQRRRSEVATEDLSQGDGPEFGA
ncbi:hypothetical protein [Rhodococcus globerulus]|uniref:hypothetical protein n=1 Tax=Rhodococcus globerulus TaxID=33008 RepID=UPI001C57C0C3|nr:hypothetical protein [Rhodococcus globerulus]QXW04050.1 hypothetical protein KYT97_08525 [Rhodococcus globerulus]